MISDEAFSNNNGVITNNDIIMLSITNGENYRHAMQFSIKKAGTYHFFFGPWQGTFLVLDDTIPVTVSSNNGGKFEWIAFHAADIAIAATNDDVKPRVVMWIVSVVEESRDLIQDTKLFSKGYPFTPERTEQIREELTNLGFTLPTIIVPEFPLGAILTIMIGLVTVIGLRFKKNS